jgi:phospholipid transport system substrate-binding protein
LNKPDELRFESCVAWSKRLALVLAVAFVLASGAAWRATAATQAPEATVAAFDNALQHAMQDAQHLGYHGRYDLLAPAMNHAFDFPTMTRIAVGTSWSKLSVDQQKALGDAFGRFSIATYANQFNSYSGERFAVTGRTQSSQGVVVATTMTPAKGDAIRFNYLLHQVDGAWRIIDIYLDGTVSQLAVRRGEFSAVLARSGPSGLLQLLEDRIKALAEPR